MKLSLALTLSLALFCAPLAFANDGEGKRPCQSREEGDDPRTHPGCKSGVGSCEGLPSLNMNYTPVDGWARHPRLYAHFRACYEQMQCLQLHHPFCIGPVLSNDD